MPFYLQNKRDKQIIDELLKKVNENKTVTFPWDEAVNNPDALAQDDDHIPLDEINDEEFMKAVRKNVEANQEVDKEAEEANKEIN